MEFNQVSGSCGLPLSTLSSVDNSVPQLPQTQSPLTGESNPSFIYYLKKQIF